MTQSKRKIFGLFGVGGHAREVMPMAEPFLRAQGFTDVLFIQTEIDSETVNGWDVVSEDAFAAMEGMKYFNVGIGNSNVREAIVARMKAAEIEALSLVASNATIYQENEIGQGMILSAQATITSNIHIGDFVHINMHSYVAHDCVLADYVTLAPGVCCNGNVHIGEHAYIGSGAVLRNGTPNKPLVIGARAVVGMGAVVTKDVAPDTVVVGSPARPKT